MSKYIPADKLITALEKRMEETKSMKPAFDQFWAGQISAFKRAVDIAKSLQQEQSKLQGYDKALLEVKSKIDELYEETSIGLSEYDSGLYNGIAETCMKLRGFIKARLDSDEQPEENKLPDKRTRVNYAICKLQAFKSLREAIVLDDYVYDEGKCYRENLLNYIHAIPESRLVEIRSYLKEKGWWPYNDEADWEDEPAQPEVDLENAAQRVYESWMGGTMDDVRRDMVELGKVLNARKEESK